jgi:hypothetical protein
VPCQRERQRLTRAGRAEPHTPRPAYTYLGTLPAENVLVGAACTPEMAHLFDPQESRRYGTTTKATTQRHDAAKAVCAQCPVAAACFSDAVVQRRSGVYGGHVMHEGVVQGVSDVQDSTAC